MKETLIKLAQTGKLFLGIATMFSVIWGLNWDIDVVKWTQWLDLIITLLTGIVVAGSGLLTYRKIKRER